MNEEAVVHPDNRILLGGKNKGAIKSEMTWKKLKFLLLSERSQFEKAT